MAKEASSENPSIPLHEVLEAEFAVLHKESPADHPNSTDPNIRLNTLWAAIHNLREKRAALCISGGGIRSATFGLGILQGLARCELLNKFHYLSTVSGGGYIGSWLSAWIKNQHPEGIDGVVKELNGRSDSALDPEPQPIRHLREFSNYLTPKTGLMSVDFWTLIATFVRNMFLNWLVLISWLAAAMMIPKFYLAAISLQPGWANHPYNQIMQFWNFWLTFLLALGSALVAVAMAYAIIDVPSTGNARLSQSRFLKFRQLPLLLASLILAAWWALFRNVHGSEPFQPTEWRPKFILFAVASYLSGGLLAAIIVLFRKWHKARPDRFLDSLLRAATIVLTAVFAGICLWAVATRIFLVPAGNALWREANAVAVLLAVLLLVNFLLPGPFIGSFLRTGTIVLTAAFAGVCLWAMATRMFLDHRSVEFTLTDTCEATQIPSGEKIVLPKGTTGEVTKITDGTYTIGIVGADQARVRIAEKDLQPLMTESTLDSQTRLNRFTFTGKCRAIEVPSGRERSIEPGTTGEIIEHVERSYTVETDAVTARIAKSELEAFELNPAPGPQADWTRFRLKSLCEGTDPKNYQVTLPAGSTGVIRQIGAETYAVKTDRVTAIIPTKGFDAVEVYRPVPAPANHAVAYVCFAPALIMAVVMLVNFLFTGLASKVTKDEDREWWGRSAAWILITIFGWILVNVIVLWGAQAITATTANQLAVFLGNVKADPTAKALLGAFGGVSGIAGALLALRRKLGKKLDQKAAFQWLLVLVAVVFFVLFAVVISWALLLIGSQPWVQDTVARVLGERPWQGRRLFVIFFLTGVTALFGIVMGFFINANKFSLHATYRNRLIRAYLAASRSAGTRKPSLFTGFDPDDNFELHKLSAEKPLHVLNGALNLVHGEELAWQERHAESFTMSRLHCGCMWLGYRPSAEYGGGKGKAITLGTALAISGAAANPNMGYHSSPVVGLLMTLFNVRLGWWLGNPRSPMGDKTWRRSGPGYSVGPLFSEAIGNTTDSYKYVNLSDGGHFENLGLYEMVLRRCHFIVVSDAGQDPECSFADLGEAVRKIRIDFGIPIEFELMTIYPRSPIDALESADQKGHNCAIGRIRYSAVDGSTAPDGIIVYIKPACYGDEPRDIYEYFKRSETFPHESTADQFFSESQFESYRMLGAHTMEKLCTDCGGDFRHFVNEIFRRHLQTEVPKWLKKLI
jgi:hypothetical protein